ncbi:MAG: TRAM domain-containing protein, partial [Nitrospirae bacterium]
NRGYTFKEYEQKIDMLRSLIPEIAITSDFIVGFPQESDEDFRETLRAIESIKFDGVFAFKYSKRPFTKALNMDGHVDESIKAERLMELLKLQDSITLKKNKALEGEVVEVLLEGRSSTDSEKLTGRTRSNKIVHFFPKGGENIGDLLNIRIIEARHHHLYGEIIYED